MSEFICQEGGEDCEPATRPDPRTPPLDTGECVLCESCFQVAVEDMIADHEYEILNLKGMTE